LKTRNQVRNIQASETTRNFVQGLGSSDFVESDFGTPSAEGSEFAEVSVEDFFSVVLFERFPLFGEVSDSLCRNDVAIDYYLVCLLFLTSPSSPFVDSVPEVFFDLCFRLLSGFSPSVPSPFSPFSPFSFFSPVDVPFRFDL